MNFCIAGYLRIKSSPNNAIWFINTNFLEAIKYFRLSIGAIVLFEVFTLRALKLKKSYSLVRGCQRGAYILVWQRVWIMKLLHDYIHDPLKQTKRTLWCFARLTINSVSGCFRRFSGKFLKQMERLKRHSYFPGWKISGGNWDFVSSNLFLNISVRLSPPFFVKRNWLRQMVNAITERNQN